MSTHALQVLSANGVGIPGKGSQGTFKIKEKNMKKKSAVALCICFLFSINFLWAETWSATKRLTWNSGTSESQVMAVDSSNNIFIAYEDDTSGTPHIYLKKSTNSGLTWTNKQLTWGTYQKVDPTIGVDSSDSLHLVFKGDSNYLYSKKSTDAGNTWSGAKKMTWSFAYDPDMTFGSGSSIYVVYRRSDSGNSEIYFINSTDSGNTWSAEKRVTWNAGTSNGPKIAYESTGNIHVIWSDDSTDSYQVLYRKSTNDGASWSPTKRMTWTSKPAYRLAMAIDSSDTIYAFFELGYYDIYFKKSTDSGASWTGTKRITWTYNSFAPIVCIDTNDTIHLCWKQFYSMVGGDVCYKQSTNGGTSWVGLKRLTYGILSHTDRPAAIASDSNDDIHFAWHGEKPGNYEIFYKNRK